MARKASKLGIKKRLKRRVKALKPVEAPLMSKAKSDQPKAQQDAPEDKKDGAEAAPEGKDQSGKPDGGNAEAKQEGDKPEGDKPDPKAAEGADAVPGAEKANQAASAPAVEESPYAELLHPRDLPKKHADADEPAPGLAPPGDSRSFRRTSDGKQEFCLIYRLHRELVTRRGLVGKWGEVKVIQYPSDASAATAYAHACSDLTGEGFYDLRE